MMFFLQGHSLVIFFMFSFTFSLSGDCLDVVMLLMLACLSRVWQDLADLVFLVRD